ncbi:GGDEF domain-containing protein [Burkholderia sp. 3C]
MVNGLKQARTAPGETAPRLGALAEGELKRSGFRLSFPDALEARYWQDIATERLRELRFIALWGIAGYFVLGVLLNLIVIRHPDWPDVAVQLVGSSTLVLVIIRLGLSESAPAMLREVALLACCLVCSVAAILVVATKPEPATLRDYLLAIPPSSFVLVFVRLRFHQAAAFFATNLAVFALCLFHSPALTPDDATFLIGFMCTLLLPALVGGHAFERVSRRIYLHRLLDRLRNESLAASNAALTGLSYTDSLTGIANRRRLDEALAELVAMRGSAGALLLVDIDRFKAFNDRHGHLAGDTCLCHVAQCLTAQLRRGDLLARFGGEEFAILLPNAALAEAERTAERLREAVQGLHFIAQGQHANVTISIGVAERAGLTTPDALIGAADTALYAAKRAGRNRVQVASGAFADALASKANV